jgi:alcohol dehydrogenase class IV
MLENEFRAPQRLLGRGVVAELPALFDRHGHLRVALISDAGLKQAGLLDRVAAIIGSRLAGSPILVAENPAVVQIDAAADEVRAMGSDAIVALGGGSVIDSAKGVQLALNAGESIRSVLGRPEKIAPPLLPLIAVPTTSGSGSESSVAVGIHPEGHLRAVGTRSAALVPSWSVCDPELTLTLPPGLTAATGLDAFGHCLEGYLALPANDAIDALALEGLARVATFLSRAVRFGDDIDARAAMMTASWEGGVAIAKGLGPAHAIANALGDRGLHHGALVAAALRPVIAHWETVVPERMAAVARSLHVSVGGVAEWYARLLRELGVRRTVPYGAVSATERADIVLDAYRSPFNRACPKAPEEADFRRWVDELVRG